MSERDSNELNQLVDKLSEIDEGEPIRCQLASTLTCGDRDYESATFRVEERSNTDISDMVGETNVARLTLTGHPINSGSDGEIELWTISVEERPDGSATHPVVYGDYWGGGDYLTTDKVEIEAIDVVYQCRKCDSLHTFDGELARCYGTTENPHRHTPVDVVYPCGVCGDPITTMEICQKCADEKDVDAFTHPNEAWRKMGGEQ